MPRRGIYDNMRTAVDKIGRGKERQVNARFSAMVSHFLFEAEFCNPASGCPPSALAADARLPLPGGAERLNDWLETRCRELWAQTLHGSQPGAIVDVWAEKMAVLMQLSRPFDGFVEHAKRVSPTCLVHLDRNRYSVPASFANRPVSLRVSAGVNEVREIDAAINSAATRVEIAEAKIAAMENELQRLRVAAREARIAADLARARELANEGRELIVNDYVEAARSIAATLGRLSEIERVQPA